MLVVIVAISVEARQRAALNGLATLGGSIAKGTGPIVAGCLVASSFKWVEKGYGAIVIFTLIGLMGLVVLGPLHGLPADTQTK